MVFMQTSELDKNINNMKDWRRGRHAIFKLYVHLVFTPKYRRKVFTNEMLVRLEAIMKTQCFLCESELLELNGEGDHIHMLICYPAKLSVSILVKTLKGVSARRLRQEFYSEIENKFWGDHFWSPSYCAVSSDGAPLDVIKKYIEEQDRPTSANQERMAKVVEARWNKV
jgi:putative transposase